SAPALRRCAGPRDRHARRVDAQSQPRFRQHGWGGQIRAGTRRFDGHRRRLGGAVLDLAMVTREVWSLNPSLDFGSTGGESKYGLGLSDSNVLGTGRGAGVRYESDEDRTGVSVYHEDPNLAGTRTELDLLVENNDDGSRHFAKIERPFYSLDTRFSTGLR